MVKETQDRSKELLEVQERLGSMSTLDLVYALNLQTPDIKVLIGAKSTADRLLDGEFDNEVLIQRLVKRDYKWIEIVDGKMKLKKGVE